MPTNIEARFTIHDNGTTTLRNIGKETKKAKKETESFGNTAANAGKKANNSQKQANETLKQTSKGYQQATEDVKTYIDAQGRLRDEKGKFLPMGGAGGVGGAAGTAGNPFRSWTVGAMSFAAAGYTVKKAWDAAMSAINASAMQKVQETTFQALTNSKEAGSALYDYVSAYARVSAFGREELANATTAYITYAKSTDQLERMIKLTERLYAKDPTQGAEGAVFAMRELLSGDTMSIKDRFNMSGFSGEKIRNFANTGDIEGMLDYVDQMFNRFGATQEVVDANYDNLITQTNIFASNMKTAIAESATPAMETLSGVMQKLNAEMAVGKYQPFINLMSNGMKLIGSGIAWVADNLNWLAPTIVGVTTAAIAYQGTLLLVKGATTAATAATAIMNVVTGAATGNFVKAAAGAVALAGGLAAIAAVSKKVDAQTDIDLSSAKAALANFENDFPSAMQANVPVEVANSAPIKVKGEVEIEEESLRYMLDIQGQKWLAKFTTATLAPQNVFNNTVIRETADFDEFTQTTIESLQTVLETAPTL
jgi:flagellar hook-basal body complex protein FliE|nr:MAG TPA: tail tape measure [Caudoviricetes sp.]